VASELTIPGVLERTRLATPAATALVGENGVPVTYDELHEQVRVAARALLGLGVEPSRCVALWAPNSVEWVVASLATACVGAALVPCNTRWRVGEVLELVRRADCALWLAPAGPARDAGRDAWDGPVVAPGALAERTELASEGALDARLRALTADTVSHVQYTSGTTGRPKGALLAHGAMVSTTRSWVEIVGLTASDRYPVVSPMSHIGGHKTGTLACLVAGATSLPVARFDAAALLDLVDAERATVLQGPPAVFAALLDGVDARGRAPSSLRVAVTGSAVIPPPLLRRMYATLGLERVHAGYGLTEATGVCTITRAGDPLDLVAESSGRAVDGVELEIVDGQRARVATGERGEILVRGPGVMRGYLDDPEATAEALVDRGSGGVWLATGDVGWVDAAGNLRIVDRLHDLLIVGGFNTSPAEIERVLGDHPAVAQVAVVGVPDDRLGEVPGAFVVLSPGATLDEAGLLAWAHERLANYKVPRHSWFVDALPLTAVDKVDKRSLADRARDAVEA
jgi:acyl-CoA synthetase (AMP-forming)/AMP-acid ligase II